MKSEKNNKNQTHSKESKIVEATVETEKLTLAYRVRQCLDTDEPITVSEIADKLGVDYRAVFQVVKQTKNRVQSVKMKKTKNGEMPVYAYTTRQPKPVAPEAPKTRKKKTKQSAPDNDVIEPTE